MEKVEEYDWLSRGLKSMCILIDQKNPVVYTRTCLYAQSSLCPDLMVIGMYVRTGIEMTWQGPSNVENLFSSAYNSSKWRTFKFNKIGRFKLTFKVLWTVQRPLDICKNLIYLGSTIQITTQRALRYTSYDLYYL